MPLISLPIVAALVVKFFWLLAAVVGMVLAVRLIGVAGRMDDAALARRDVVLRNGRPVGRPRLESRKPPVRSHQAVRSQEATPSAEANLVDLMTRPRPPSPRAMGPLPVWTGRSRSRGL